MRLAKSASWLVAALSLLGCGASSPSAHEPQRTIAPSEARCPGAEEVRGSAAAAAPNANPATPRLPDVPTLPQRPLMDGNAYTTWGASYLLRSRVHRQRIIGKEIELTGYITATNLPGAPECAVHPTGVADPVGCRPPVPAFWVGDSKSAKRSEGIKVMGWASNFAQIHDAIIEFARSGPDAEMLDAFWGVPIPNPLPATGARVTVRGTYSDRFVKASSGNEEDEIQGILTGHEITILEPATHVATLPGMPVR